LFEFALYWLFECFGDSSADHSVSAYLGYLSPFQFVDTYRCVWVPVPFILSKV